MAGSRNRKRSTKVSRKLQISPNKTWRQREGVDRARIKNRVWTT